MGTSTSVRIGFLINPIAGMGGRVGLKGTDGVAVEAEARGAQPHAPQRAAVALAHLASLSQTAPTAGGLAFVTCGGAMGDDALRQAGFDDIAVVFQPSAPTSADDTRAAVARFLEVGVDLILFCGGDGTARDICAAAGPAIPILGIPAGVKMYSGVFGKSPTRSAEVVIAFVRGDLTLATADVVDLDEGRYRQGEWAVRRYAHALTPVAPRLTQSAKAIIRGQSDAEQKREVAAYLAECVRAEPGVLFIIGPGSTMAAVGEALGLELTLLGVDAVRDGALVARDLDEAGLLKLLQERPPSRLLLSPLGAQGFVLGRGNLQLSPAVLRQIGPGNVVIAATATKLAHTPQLSFDTGDADLDAELVGRGYVPVVIGHDRRRMVKASL